jgi:hypothetical protein
LGNKWARPEVHLGSLTLTFAMPVPARFAVAIGACRMSILIPAMAL